jgi:hypothetical protein
MPCPENDTAIGEVTGFLDIPAGQLAFAETEVYGPVSILLNATHWRGGSAPQKSEMIVIVGLSKHRKGWRAIEARRFTPDDESLIT